MATINSGTPLAIRVRGVTKSFLGTRALDDIDFEVARGEVHGLVGKNGAGKSTFMNILSGAQPPDSGEIVVGGKAFKALNPAEGGLPSSTRTLNCTWTCRSRLTSFLVPNLAKRSGSSTMA